MDLAGCAVIGGNRTGAAEERDAAKFFSEKATRVAVITSYLRKEENRQYVACGDLIAILKYPQTYKVSKS